MGKTSAKPESNPDAQVTAMISVPFGSIISYPGDVAPNGWLLCDGRAISQQDYPNLYGLVGAKVPDLRSRFVIGSGNGSGLSNRPLFSVGGEETHILITSEIPNHSHGFMVGGGNGTRGSSHGNAEGWTWNEGGFYQTTYDTGSDGSHNNMPPFYALTYIIKY